MFTFSEPVPMPRRPPTKEDLIISPNRKKPIPQPRKMSNLQKKETSPKNVRKMSENSPKIVANTESKKNVCPVPTAQFKSYKRFPEPPSLPGLS
jgi:hypothetical protein